jgi:formate-nitrite transporter family protein
LSIERSSRIQEVSLSGSDTKLTDEELAKAEENIPAPAKVVHAAVAIEGKEELERPASSLFWSSVAAGIIMMTSVSVSGALHHYVPDAPGSEAIAALGYPVGFVMVVLGRMQLFTEQTVVAILPFARKPSRYSLSRVARLWSIVFIGNMVGTATVSALAAYGHVQSEAVLSGMLAVAGKLKERAFFDTLMQAIPAGFIMASIAWIRAADDQTSFGVVIVLTYAIGLCGFAHVIAGAAEAFLLMWSGQATPQWVAASFLVPALIGNVVGGTGLFAALAHAQVRQEI